MGDKGVLPAVGGTNGKSGRRASDAVEARCGYNSQSDGEDERPPQLKVADVEVIPPTPAIPYFRATIGTEFDKTTGLMRLDTMRRKVSEVDLQAALQRLADGDVELTDRSVITPRPMQIRRDLGIIPDALQLLIEREPNRRWEVLQDELLEDAAGVTLPEVKEMLEMVGRFLLAYEWAEDRRFLYSLDKKRVNKLPAYLCGMYWVILAVPTVRIHRGEKPCVDGKYLQARAPQLTRLFQRESLLIVREMQTDDLLFSGTSRFQPYWGLEGGMPATEGQPKGRKRCSKGGFAGTLQAKSRSDGSGELTRVRSETQLRTLSATEAGGLGMKLKGGKDPDWLAKAKKVAEGLADSPVFKKAGIFPRSTRRTAGRVASPPPVMELPVEMNQPVAQTVASDTESEVVVMDEGLPEVGEINPDVDVVGTEEVGRAKLAPPIEQQSLPPWVPQYRPPFWAEHTRLWPQLQCMGGSMAAAVDNLEPNWQPRIVSQNQQVSGNLMEYAREQGGALSYHQMVEGIIRTARGYEPGMYGHWLADGCGPILLQAVADYPPPPTSSIGLHPQEIQRQADNPPQYFIDETQQEWDRSEKVALESYEQSNVPIKSAMIYSNGLFNPSRHMGGYTYFLAAWEEGSQKFLPMPVTRPIEILGQYLLGVGTPEEVTAVSLYFFRRWVKCRQGGGDIRQLLIDSVEDREEAEQLRRSLFRPKIRRPFTLQRVRVIPRLLTAITAMQRREDVKFELSGGETSMSQEALELVTMLGRPITEPPGSEVRAILPGDAVMYQDSSTLEGEGSIRDFIFSSDRPDVAPAVMRPELKWVTNTWGEAVTNALYGLANGCLPEFRWQTFTGSEFDVSDELQNRTVLIGGVQARELARVLGSSYCGAVKCDVTDIAVGLAQRCVPLWQKNGELAEYAVVWPDESDAYPPKGLLDIPSRLCRKSKEILVIASGVLVLQIGDQLRVKQVIPIFLDKLVRARETSDVYEAECQWVSRALREFIYKAAKQLGQFIWVSLSGRTASILANKFHFGVTTWQFWTSIGPKEELKFIHAALENAFRTQQARSFWTPEYQQFLFHANENPSFDQSPMQFFRVFSYEVDDVGGRLVYNGDLEALRERAKGSEGARKHWQWVQKCIETLSFDIDTFAASVPPGCDRKKFVSHRRNLRPNDGGLTFQLMAAKQVNPVFRAMEKVWQIAAEKLGKEGDRVPMRKDPNPVRMSNHYLKPREYEGETLKFLWQSDSETLPSSLRSGSEQLEENMSGVPVGETPVLPVTKTPTGRRSLAFTSSNERVVIGAAAPVLSTRNPQTLHDTLQNFMCEQNAKDPVDPREGRRLSAETDAIRKHLESWWETNIGPGYSRATSQLLLNEAIRMGRCSGVYSMERQEALLAVRQNPNFLGFFDPLPVPSPDTTDVSAAPLQLPGPSAVQMGAGNRQSRWSTDPVAEGVGVSHQQFHTGRGRGTVGSRQIVHDSVTFTGDVTSDGRLKEAKSEPQGDSPVIIKTVGMPNVVRSPRKITPSNTPQGDVETWGFSSAVANQPESANRPESRASSVGAMTTALMGVSAADELAKWAIQAGREMSIGEAAGIIGDERRSLPYPMGDLIPDIKLLEFFAPPDTGDLAPVGTPSMGPDDLLRAKLGAKWAQVDVSVLRGHLYVWAVRNYREERRATVESHQLTRPILRMLIKSVNNTLKAVIPERKVDVITDPSIDCV